MVLVFASANAADHDFAFVITSYACPLWVKLKSALTDVDPIKRAEARTKNRIVARYLR